MNSKERMLSLFSGKKIDCTPAAPHWWGLYKFQIAGLARGYRDEDECWGLCGAPLAEVDSLFYETFKPDWLHLGCETCNAAVKGYKDKNYMEARRRVKSLDSRALIDEYVCLKYQKADEILKAGIYDHVRILSDKYGDSVFIAMNEGNPICDILDPSGSIGFEEGLIALMEKPELMEYMIFREYEMTLEKVRALKECGCHGYIGSETYCSSDLISPSTYRDLIFPAHKYFYSKVREMGMVPLVYFLGDIMPLICDINRLGAAALLVEEPKKGYSLDVVEIRKKLHEDITLFGNLDSVYVLLKGSSGDVQRETLRQLEASKYGRFVMSNGCPIAFDTPRENIITMIDTAHKFVLGG